MNNSGSKQCFGGSMMDVLDLARLQFALTITYHILFPGLTIGLSLLLFGFECRNFWRPKAVLDQAGRFLSHLFSLIWILGVATGVAVALQFNANWGALWDFAGHILKPPFGFGVKTILAIEIPCLLALTVLRYRVPRWVLPVSALIVMFGTHFSVVRVLIVSSWMQYPVGYEMINGVAMPSDWMAILFNPTFPVRYAHVVLGSYFSAALLLISLGSWALLRCSSRQHDLAHTLHRTGFWVLTIVLPLQFIAGHMSGTLVRDHQPAKLAAMEAHWDSKKPADFVIFAWPNEDQTGAAFDISIPRLGSLIVTHSLDGTFQGLNDIAPEDRPRIMPVFISFRLMVGCAVLAVFFCIWGHMLRRSRPHGNPADSALYLKAGQWIALLGPLATIAGWMVTEIGRQPWVAYGLARTAELQPSSITFFSFLAYAYFMLIVVVLSPYIFRKMGHLWIETFGPMQPRHYTKPQAAQLKQRVQWVTGH
jgi:cytochrome d ubiquinol oxidase subunit I